MASNIVFCVSLRAFSWTNTKQDQHTERVCSAWAEVFQFTFSVYIYFACARFKREGGEGEQWWWWEESRFLSTYLSSPLMYHHHSSHHQSGTMHTYHTMRNTHTGSTWIFYICQWMWNQRLSENNQRQTTESHRINGRGVYIRRSGAGGDEQGGNRQNIIKSMFTFI